MPDRASLTLSLYISHLLLKRSIQTTYGRISIGHLLSGAVHCMSLPEEDSMAWLTGDERAFLQAVSHLGYSNPFLPERITYEREALGTDFVEAEAVWSLRVDQPDAPLRNNTHIMTRVETLIPQLHARLARGASASDQDLLLYEDGALFHVFHRYYTHFDKIIVRAMDLKRAPERCGFYAKFLQDWEQVFHIPGVALSAQHDAAHLFACFFQVR